MKNKGILKILFIIILIISLTSISLFYYKEQNISLDNVLAYTENDPISFNYTSGFYTNDIDIEITKSVELSSDVEIYYTLNGDDPTKANSLYDSPIHLSIIDDETRVYPLKVILYVNGSYSKIYEEDYVLSTDDSYDLPIISITSDWSNLYDYQTGIMVDGVEYEEFGGVRNFHQRGEEWNRIGKVTIFEKGSGTSSFNINLSISGKSGIRPLSLDIKCLDEKKIDIFSTSNEENLSINYKVNELIIRMGSQDINNGNIRMSLAYELSKESNYDGYAEEIRSIVFLNGKFYGLGTIAEKYNKSNISKKYSLDDENVEKYKGNSEVSTMESLDIGELFTSDLNIQKNRE
ncbi:MAG TPA: chitobiase/beta-hexosaminidase C-terminal domain-containing protein, partial [Bacilli bacterium]|nr:chitobiase/beta-hexosaminidase C-terminal domain-containing protein [Bacilli bacterium]